jgi:hypothetical protein
MILCYILKIYMSSTEINIELNNNIQMDKHHFQKMVFIMNALDTGWTIKKNGDSYVFTKKHENKREVFMENYLENFVISNMKISK